MVPWNRMISMDDVSLSLEGAEDVVEVESCPGTQHDYYTMKPVVLSTWQVTQLSTCASKTAIVAESQASSSSPVI